MVDNLRKSFEKRFKCKYILVAKKIDGTIKWIAEASNIVVDTGLEESIDSTLLNVAVSPTWFIMLTDGTPTVAASDTMASHAGWVEVTAYSEGVRQTWTGVRTGQVVTNSAAVAVITCDTNATIFGGAALTNDNTKGGTTGTLFSVAAFDLGDKSLDDGETLDITYQITAADDGV